MGKGAESGLTVMGSHAAGSDASKGKARNTRLQDDIVETDSPGAGGTQKFLLLA